MQFSEKNAQPDKFDLAHCTYALICFCPEKKRMYDGTGLFVKNELRYRWRDRESSIVRYKTLPSFLLPNDAMELH